MIFDSLKNKERYKDFPLLYQALNYLAQLKPDELPDSTVVLIKDTLFLNPVSLVSRPEAECIYEAHKKYTDLHYILEGVEGIATAAPSALTETSAYDEAKDIMFFEGPEDGRYYLKPGQFMVCFPEDAHKVAMMKDNPAPIKKIVFKILAS